MSYYGCTGKHVEFTCLSHYYQTTGRRRFHYKRWCAVCQAKYNDPDVLHGVIKRSSDEQEEACRLER